ncbi:disease resistance protein RPV1-like [Syzygium oleosum]|uniref:disease resistance protein RPV1-like n=1 Tax=Syzygium oleosum TaxID=219896 RepID=UPI0024BB72DE|nr:disease resistance protein RPV1-like [Syzygium oleosum]
MEGSAKKRRICENDGTAGGASSTHTSTEGQGMATSSGHDYEVFLSFRGPDTRAAFTDFLYTSLDGVGIRTFKDDESLRVGEQFEPKLLQAINQSKILIPIFSKGYASSVWCLKELAQMVECQKTGRQTIMPIFYDVAPSEVRYQTGGYAEALRSHEEKERFGKEIISQWKAALSAVSTINGWNLHSEKETRREGEFARKVTHEIFSKLKKAYLELSKCLVSVDKHVAAIMEMIGAQTRDTRIIGIYGMGGIGKTTIAKIIYNQLLENFEGCCFLSNIREMSERKGIECLQNQLISDILKNKCTNIRNIDDGIKIIKDRLSNKRVLLLLDDVHEKKHTDPLVGERDWFAKGSKLIITTRNKEVLDVLKVDNCYELMGMDRSQSLQLFSKHAFRRDFPLDKYIDQSNKVIDIAKGLPLALEVIGSLLSYTEERKWNDILEKLENVPHKEVQRNLKISYDALEPPYKHIFLDIACLFIGYNKNVMVHFWEKTDFYPEVAMDVLQNMSLIKIEEHNRVWMHDQLRDLGREIVRQESNTKIEKQSRVWDPKKGLDLLKRRRGNKEVQALRLKLDHRYCFTYEGFESLSDLRFLEIEVGSLMENSRAEERLLWHKSPSNVPLANENSYLFPQLRWLSWQCIPPTFNITNFSMEDVVILDLSWSGITHDWKGWSHMKVMKNLKVMDLSYCSGLERTPNFLALSNLERLSLNNCGQLVKIDKSICQLKSLKYLSLNCCKCLDELPHTIGNLELLIELHISGTGIERLPDSIGNLKNLKVVRMRRNPTKKIPDTLWTIEKLEEIDALYPIDFDVEIGDGISRNRSLRILRLEQAEINALPRLLPESLIILELSALRMQTFPNLSNLTNLKGLKLIFVPRDGEPVEEYEMPRWIGKLSKLESLLLASPQVTALPTEISLLPRLRNLYLDAPNLRDLPSLPSSLLSLVLISDHLPTLPTDCRSLLPRLRSLYIRCPKLGCLPSLPSSLLSLDLQGCRSCCSTGDISNLKELSTLKIRDCAISEIRGLDGLQNLGELWLMGLPLVEIFFDLSNSNKLRHIGVAHCSDLVEIQGKLPPTLIFLALHSCGSLRNLPDLSNLKRDVVRIEGCGKLVVDEILRSTRRS